MEDYSFEHAETRYKIETADKRELNLYLNASKMACVLYNLLEWRRSIYNGKNYDDVCYLYDGKLYTLKEWFDNNDDIIKKEDLDEHGMVLSGKVKKVYLESDLERILGDKLESVADFIFNYME